MDQETVIFAHAVKPSVTKLPVVRVIVSGFEFTKAMFVCVHVVAAVVDVYFKS